MGKSQRDPGARQMKRGAEYFIHLNKIIILFRWRSKEEVTA